MNRKRLSRQKRMRYLTPLRVEYVRLIEKGWTNNQIAEHYCIQHDSVSGTLTKIYTIAGVHNRHDLVKWAKVNGII